MPTIPVSLSFLFDVGEMPWTDLPAVGAKPSATSIGSTIFVSSDFTIENIDGALADNGVDTLFFVENGYDLPDLTNNGSLWIQNVGAGAYAITANNSNLIINNGTIVALAKGADAYAFSSSAWGILQNNGTIQVVSNGGDATGYATYSPGAWSGNASSLNTGSIEVWSGAGRATGISLANGTFSSALQNSGDIVVNGYSNAVGVLLGRDSTVVNSGLIVAHTGDGTHSYGVQAGFGGFENLDLDNSGTIEADVAITSFATTSILNTGQINGNIVLSILSDSIANQGTINGDVALGDGADLFNTQLGAVNGAVDLGLGDDTAFGGTAGDTILGGWGADLIAGGGGADFLDGGQNFDSLSYQGSSIGISINLSTNASSGGDATGDTVSGFENVFGSNHNDTLTGADSVANLLSGGAGNDSLSGLSGHDSLFGGTGNDTLIGGSGNDSLTGAAGADIISGGAGVDKADYTKASAGVNASLASGGISGDAAGDTYSSIEILSGSNFGDTLTGGNLNDDLRGRGGSDAINGGLGNDKLNGASGNDTLDGGAGNDTLTGGGHNDTFKFSGNFGADTIADMNEGADIRDVIRLIGLGSAFDTFGEVLAATTQVGMDAVINFGGGNTITLTGIDKNNLHQNDFLFG